MLCVDLLTTQKNGFHNSTRKKFQCVKLWQKEGTHTLPYSKKTPLRKSEMTKSFILNDRWND